MVVATHQPIFLPWPGLFFKAAKADVLVLLDRVQFPLGRGWMTRNRLKSEQGELWLRVPVHKKGRGLQRIDEVELFEAADWRGKHLRGVRQNYARAPYLEDYLPQLRAIYEADHRRLVDLNLALIRFLMAALNLDVDLRLQSQLGVQGRGTALLVHVCEAVGARSYLAFPTLQKYLDVPQMQAAGLNVQFVPFHPPVYPQLWGDFIYNLSTLDLLLNCGPRSREILRRC